MRATLPLLAALTLGITSPAMAAPWEADKPRHKDKGPAIAAALVGAVIGVELAQRDRREDRRENDPPPAAQVQPRITPQQAYAAIARSTPGHQLNTSLVTRNGRPYYEIRWQTDDGRRIEVVVDATSGVLVSSS